MFFKSFVCSLLLTLSAAALADSKVGDEVTGQLQIGKFNFALPPGKWTVVSEREAKNTTDGGFNSTSSKTQYIVQASAEGKFIAAALFSVPISSSSTGGWNDATCDRKDTLYRDTLDGSLRFPTCHLINHSANFWGGGAPTNEFDKAIWSWFRSNKISLPYNAILTSYVKYFSGDFVRSNYTFNPELLGSIDADKKSWAESPWNINFIESDVVRQAYIEQVKVWSQAMIKNSRATLMDGKAADANLPPLPGAKL
jgi:hypothetical protein